MEVKLSGRFFIGDESNKSDKDFEDEDFAIKIEVSQLPKKLFYLLQ